MYKNLWKIYKSQYHRTFLWTWGGFLLILVSSYFVASLLTIDYKNFIEDLGSDQVDKTNEGTPSYVWHIFLNNIMVPLQMILLALVPIPFLFYIVLLYNAVIYGFIIFIFQDLEENFFRLFLSEVLFHGVIEISAFILMSCLIFHFQLSIIKKIIVKNREKKKQNVSSILLAKHLLIFLFFIILPLIALAAIGEGISQ
ncbi:stage II sporulation protein M [Marinococcus sp. PL1-022]|uniref:stage II sporulation protein M n=1 Tax=Marinococcus sp. PL1-022 TaxID=3095363 RepID=UPI0029C1B793|nr:stage II sporulation protein M [Marinococcus sp. PL1-022]MDX6154480.1 stage II sporulation protein M [Marinococcus sp. PL1-022]